MKVVNKCGCNIEGSFSKVSLPHLPESDKDIFEASLNIGVSTKLYTILNLHWCYLMGLVTIISNHFNLQLLLFPLTNRLSKVGLQLLSPLNMSQTWVQCYLNGVVRSHQGLAWPGSSIIAYISFFPHFPLLLLDLNLEIPYMAMFG